MLKIQNNIPLKEYSTFKIGGPAKYFTCVKTTSQLAESLEWAKKNNYPFFFLGNGSNILFSDKGYKGLIIKIQLSGLKSQDTKIICGAGNLINEVQDITISKGLTGFEWAAGIPGTIGGAIFGNAGAFGREMKDVVENVKALNLKTLKPENFKNKKCQFFYRSSIFKIKRNWVILEAELEFKKAKKEDVLKKIKEDLFYRIGRHPLKYPSIGSIFKNIKFTPYNPENLKLQTRDKKNKDIYRKEKLRPLERGYTGFTKENLKLIEKFPDLKQFFQKGEIPAAYLIHSCNLKGKKIGGAQVSEKHPNFIINISNAKAKDVINLISLVKKKVRQKFRIQLEEEIIII